jgi:hypothetical protein
MKSFKLIAILLMLGIIAVSCKKEAGPAGTNGTNGNANVKVYGYGPTTFNASNFYFAYFSPAGLTGGMFDSSMIISYYSTGSGSWNVANGMEPLGNYNSIQLTNAGPPANLSFYLRNADGSNYIGADVTWDSLRIFVIPATSFRMAQKNHLDFQNYSAVRTFYCKE